MNINARSGQFNDDGTIDVRVTLHAEGAIEMTFEEQRIDTKLGPRDVDSLIANSSASAPSSRPCRRNRTNAASTTVPRRRESHCALQEGNGSISTTRQKMVWQSSHGRIWPGSFLPGDLPLRKLSSESLGIASRSMTGR